MKKGLAYLTSVFLLTAFSFTGARAATPVITDPASTSIGVFTGGDAGEGLDLDGNFVYALSIGAETDFAAKVRDANFLGLIDAEVPGATLVAGNRILNWYVVNYDDSADDDDSVIMSFVSSAASLRSVMRIVLRSVQRATQDDWIGLIPGASASCARIVRDLMML